MFYLFVFSKVFWSKVSLTSDQTRIRRVSVLDCDGFKYMANSRYAYYMDFIRCEKMFRSQLYDQTIRKGMFPVLGAQKIIYRKPLKRWTLFKITLVLEGWDDKWVYHSQLFEQDNQLCAIGYTKVAFWKAKKAQDIRPILIKCGVTAKEMTVSEEIKNTFEGDYQAINSRSKK